MNDLTARIETARKKWESLNNSKVPVIYVGTATCGAAAGALDVLDAVKATLKEKKLRAKIVQVGCIGPCYLEPLMDIRLPGEARVSYASVTPQTAKQIIEEHLIKGQIPLKYAVGHFGVNGNGHIEGVPKFFEMPMLRHQVRLVLKNCGFIDPENIDHYLANDGYIGLRNSSSAVPHAAAWASSRSSPVSGCAESSALLNR